MKKKWISILIAVTLVVTMIPSVSLTAAAKQRQAPYEVGCNSTDQIVEVPYEALGIALNGKDMYSAQVLDEQGEILAELKGKRNNTESVMEFAMPYDVDPTAGGRSAERIRCWIRFPTSTARNGKPTRANIGMNVHAAPPLTWIGTASSG